MALLFVEDMYGPSRVSRILSIWRNCLLMEKRVRTHNLAQFTIWHNQTLSSSPNCSKLMSSSEGNRKPDLSDLLKEARANSGKKG